MPTEYFETKFNRVVQPSEFKAAIVPDNLNVNVMNELSKDNLKIVKYKAGDNADRLEKLKTLKKSLAFSLIAGLFPSMETEK